ncbi:hypothetical protein [Nitratireductor sp. GZWM139]|uniref:hypothetical protein n=1 Tax=Nitratireductor sp. GZWM139 TaxID=2950541 RepID=UPI0024BDEC40|nr:hypothetical protein [Nitratireductor sp. GZWM139]MDJ1463722.1 hypothetical protein [Nitratireductor sp. GZWM139]
MMPRPKKYTPPARRSNANTRNRRNDARFVLPIGDKLRVIECPKKLQWIVQKRAGLRHGTARWDNLKYFRTRTGLIAFVRTLKVEIHISTREALLRLPEHLGGGT